MFSTLKRTNVSPFDNSGVIAKCKVDVQIVVPTRWVKLFLCDVGSTVRCMGLMGIVFNNSYYVMTNPLDITFEPNLIETVTYEEVEYYVFHITAGRDFASRELIKSTDNIKPAVKELIISGNIPWYLGLMDISDFFLHFKTLAGSNISDDDVIIDLLISLIARTQKDYRIPFRQVSHLKDTKIKWIGLSNAALSRSDGFAKLTGSYLRDGITSSGISNDKETKMEELIK